MKKAQLEKLIREMTKQAEQKTKNARYVDPTLEATESEQDEEIINSFKEMKRRPF